MMDKQVTKNCGSRPYWTAEHKKLLRILQKCLAGRSIDKLHESTSTNSVSKEVAIPFSATIFAIKIHIGLLPMLVKTGFLKFECLFVRLRGSRFETLLSPPRWVLRKVLRPSINGEQSEDSPFD